MTFKNICVWITIAALLLLASVWQFEHARRAPKGPAKLLPRLKPDAVTSVQVRLETKPQLEIRAGRTKGAWLLTEPVVDPADAEKIDGLLAALNEMQPAIYITRRELMERQSSPEKEYGLESPQATIILTQGDYRAHIYIGARTAPGDQVFLQVVGDEGIYVVDAGLLNFIPKKADEWRSTELAAMKGAAFDRITITNSGRGFELRKEETNQWRIVTSDFSPRAEASKVDQFLTNLAALKVEQFVPEDAKADLESFGLANPEFQFGLAKGTNMFLGAQFGKSATNDSGFVYARSLARKAVFVVNRTNLTPWPTMSNFRDSHLLGGVSRPAKIDVHGRDDFSLISQTNGSWKVMPQNLVADKILVRDLLRLLSEMQITEFVKDTVPPQMLPDWGLDHPALEYTLDAGDPAPSTNSSAIRLQFSTNRADKIYVRRSDELSVYAVKIEDANSLPTSSWQLRDRRIWNVPIDDLASVALQQNGTNWQMLRKGDHQWTLASGSKGFIEPLAVEETLLDLVNLSAMLWIARSPSAAQTNACGFTKDDLRITLEFKNGEKRTIELSPRTSMMNVGIAAVTLEGETWVFAVEPSLRRDIIGHLVPRRADL